MSLSARGLTVKVVRVEVVLVGGGKTNVYWNEDKVEIVTPACEFAVHVQPSDEEWIQLTGCTPDTRSHVFRGPVACGTEMLICTVHEESAPTPDAAIATGLLMAQLALKRATV